MRVRDLGKINSSLNLRFGGDNFSGSRLNVKIPRLYVNQRLARNKEEAILCISGLCVGVGCKEEKKKWHPLPLS